MPIRDYGVLKGRVAGCRQERDRRAPHFQVRVRAGGTDFRVSINVQSFDRRRPDLLHFIDGHFRHPLTERLAALDEGWHAGVPGPDGLSVDYVRGGMVERARMAHVPHDRPGPANDLNDHLHALLHRAVDDPDAEIYAFGGRWGPEPREPDDVFRFLPGNGVHDVHMNQGTPHRARHARDNGTWQDGAVFLRMRDERRWAAIFLAFQAQSWETDDDGFPRVHDAAHRAPRHPPRRPAASPRRRRVTLSPGVRIAEAAINPPGDDRGAETVTLHNATGAAVDLRGWSLANGDGARHPLSGVLPPDARVSVRLPVHVPLSNRGGAIRLLDPAGAEADAVTWTRHDARDEGRTVAF